MYEMDVFRTKRNNVQKFILITTILRKVFLSLSFSVASMVTCFYYRTSSFSLFFVSSCFSLFFIFIVVPSSHTKGLPHGNDFKPNTDENTPFCSFNLSRRFWVGTIYSYPPTPRIFLHRHTVLSPLVSLSHPPLKHVQYANLSLLLRIKK